MSNLTQRILVALVAIPLIVFFCLLGGLFFFAMIVFISTLGLHEFYKLTEKKGASPQVAVGLLFGFLVSCVFFWERLRPVMAAAGIGVSKVTMTELFLVLFLLFVPLIMLLELFRNKGSAIINTAMTVFGVCYVSFFLGSFVGLRESFVPANFPMSGIVNLSEAGAHADVYRWGGATVISVFASLWMCDSLAYFAGRFFGKHKLFERVSPKKTWEGAIAGYVGAVGAFLIAQQYVLPYLTVGNACVCGSIVGMFGQLGDLVESLLKRDAEVKDSSALIPGHGGVLDRFDSLIFVSPLLYLYLRFLVL